MDYFLDITEVGVPDVKMYLRVEHSEDDELIGMMLVAAKAFIESYLNQKFSEMETIPPELVIPCYILIAHWYEKRSIQTDRAAQEILYSFSGILDMHRIFKGGEVI